MTHPNWRLKGVWFDACKCTIPCPRSFAQPPTFGDCNGVLLWEIIEGYYGGTRLDGLRVAMLASLVGSGWRCSSTSGPMPRSGRRCRPSSGLQHRAQHHRPASV